MAEPLARQASHRPVVHDDCEGHDRLTRPAREAVDRDRHLRAHEDELGRKLRQLVPRPQAEEREPDPREDARCADAAAVLDEAACAGEPVVVGIEAGHAESGIGLERRGQIGLAVPVDRPRAVLPLTRQELVDELPRRLGVAQAQELEQEQVLRGHGHVRLELAAPPAALGLEVEQALERGLERVFGAASGVRLGLDDGHVFALRLGRGIQSSIGG